MSVRVFDSLSSQASTSKFAWLDRLCKSLPIPEDMSVRVFDSLSSQANLLVDAVMKAPAEFWKVWTLYCPALVEFSESSAVFESVVYLFKRLGVLMGESDPVLTQQLMVDV